jgi:hypothetical protein
MDAQSAALTIGKRIQHIRHEIRNLFTASMQICDLANWHVQVAITGPDSRFFQLDCAPALSSGMERRTSLQRHLK